MFAKSAVYSVSALVFIKFDQTIYSAWDFPRFMYPCGSRLRITSAVNELANNANDSAEIPKAESGCWWGCADGMWTQHRRTAGSCLLVLQKAGKETLTDQ